MRIAMRRIFPSENKWGNGMSVNMPEMQREILSRSYKVVKPQDAGEKYQMEKGDTLIETDDGLRFAVGFVDYLNSGASLLGE